MNFDGVLRDNQGISDFSIGQTINHQRGYLPLTFAQKVEGFLPIIALIQPLNKLFHYPPRDNNVSPGNHV
jgi:hypothetical protein